MGKFDSNYWLDQKAKKNDEVISTINALQAENAELKHKLASLEGEYNSKLEEAYAQLSGELTQSEKIAEQGYAEAYQIITDLRNKLENQKGEFEKALEEGYEEAYQMLLEERGKVTALEGQVKSLEAKLSARSVYAEWQPSVDQQPDKISVGELEVKLYEEYDKKLAEMKEYIVDKVDQFLQFKGQEIYEQAKRDVLTDPRMAEHKVTLDKIIDLTSNYLSDDDFASVNSSKLDEVNKTVEEMKGQLRIMEARNIRLSTENTKLNEAVRQAQELITESRKVVKTVKKNEVVNEQNERVEKVKNVTGRGKTDDGVVISEYAAPTNNDVDQLLILSGLKNS